LTRISEVTADDAAAIKNQGESISEKVTTVAMNEAQGDYHKINDILIE